MTDAIPDTCSPRVPLTLRRKFCAESEEERKKITAKVETEMMGLNFTPDPLKSQWSDLAASNANADFNPSLVTLHFWAPWVQYADLKIHVVSEPNNDPDADPENRCLVRAQFNQWELPSWLQPWELIIGNGC